VILSYFNSFLHSYLRLLVTTRASPSMSGVGNLRHACQAWHVERFSMARWLNWNTVIMIS